MYTKLLILAIVLFGIWSEYEEMSKIFEAPEKEAESLQIDVPGSAESARRTSKMGAPQSRNQKTKEEDAKEKLISGSPAPKSRKRQSKSKEDDAKEKLIKAIFQVFLLRGMRRKLVTPGTPADAILIAISMMFMIGLLCVVWFVFIFGVIKVVEPIWDRITTFREDAEESRQRDAQLHEFRTAYVEHEKENPATSAVRRGRSFNPSH